MPDKNRDSKASNGNPFVTVNQARQMLYVTPATLDRLAKMHGLTVRQIPGHGRRYYLRSEIETLAAAAIATEARV